VKGWISYAVVGLLLTVLAALLAVAVVGSAGQAGVWFAAGLAYTMQLAAFAALRAARNEPQLFLVAWAGGILVRFGAVAVVAFWLRRQPVLPLEVTLISLVVFVVLLLFLEPVFLRGRGDRGPARSG
jgi:hypothetical protein